MYEIYQSYANDSSHMKPPGDINEAKKSGLRREYFVKEVLELVEGADTWLDVGCGWGALLDHVREKGFTPKGIELTRNCLDFATMQLQIPVSNSQLIDSKIDPSSCNVVSMVHVFEHLPYPRRALKKIYDVLMPGGFFCGIVPNIASFCSDIAKEKWVWLDETHHYVHYSPVSLKQKLEEAGFEIERLYTSVGDYDYNEVLNTVKSTLPSGTSDNDILLMINRLEKEGKGEEIRFFVRKPIVK
jgi:2-polyprenyl-3-methyl-5-hydroxy-6-metoxy-1,4-benzoquinol methylase